MTFPRLWKPSSEASRSAMSVNKARGWSAQALVVLCVVLGGASAPTDGVAANAILQSVALCLILFSVWTRASAPYPAASRPLILIVGAWLLVVLLSLVPLPYGTWSSLPGREPIARGFELLQAGEPSLPISLTPERSILALLGFLPPIAMFLLTLQLSSSQRRRLAITIIAAAAVAACLGAAQIASGLQSPLRPYVITNPDMAVGFFANGNHQATLLLCALALAGFLLARAASKRSSAYSGKAAIAAPAMIALFLVVGVVTVGSLAGYGLLIPVAAGTLLIYRRASSGSVGWKWAATVGLLFTASLGLALFGPYAQQSISEQLGGDRTSRSVMAATTVQAIREHLPVGTGLGSLPDVYRTYEDPNVPAFAFVNHTHNDYLEVALETGVPGILLMLAFLVWFALALVRAWRSNSEGSNIARAASLVVFIILMHSLVDYPIRTAAIGAIFAACCALLLPARHSAAATKQTRAGDSELRHLEAE